MKLRWVLLEKKKLEWDWEIAAFIDSVILKAFHIVT